MIEQIRPFSAIKYTTSNGENCIATKKDGIVTIQGDKNGVRQMPLNEFMDVFVKDQSQKTLERIPNTVSFSGNHADKPKKISDLGFRFGSIDRRDFFVIKR